MRPDEGVDPQQIEEGEPVTVQDDVTNEPGELSLQYSGTYARSRHADDRESLEQGPTFKLGAFKDLQVSLNVNYETGRSDGHDSGYAMGDVLWHIADQTRVLPAFAFDVFYSTPFGAGHKSAAYTFRAIASRTLGDAETGPRLHLNVTEYHLTQPDKGERKDQLEIAFGGSFLPTPEGALVADVVHDIRDGPRGAQSFLEIGYTRALPRSWVVELGVGRQVTGGGNAVRVFLSVEKEIHVF